MTAPIGEPRPEARLRDRIFSAGAWTLGSYGVDLSVRFISNLILTRLLFPEAFGTIAAAMSLMGGLVLVSDFGVRSVVIQSPRSDDVEFLRSAWMFQLSHGSGVWIVLVGLCALLKFFAVGGLLPPSSVFADPALPLITSVLGLTVLFSGAESTSIPLNVRRLNYRPVVILNLTGRIISVPVTLILAWISPSVWAIVGGILTGSVARLIFSHIWIPGPSMGFNWKRENFREIVRFGRWVVVSSFGTFISQQSEVILLGILVPASTLGLYSIAKLLSSTGEGLIDQISGALALPVLGEAIRKDATKFRDQYYRFRFPIEVAAGLLSGLLFASGTFVVHFLYDARYAQAGPMLQILSLGTLSYPFLIIATAFTASGDTHITALASTLKAVSLVAAVMTGYFLFGILGAIGGIAIHRIFPSVAIVLIAHKRNWVWISHEFRIIPAFIVGLLLGRGFVLIATALKLHDIHQVMHHL